MKNLNNIQEMKQFSIALQKFLKTNNIEVKHSLMLEGFAKAMDLPDWNTLSGLLQKNNDTNYQYLTDPLDQAISCMHSAPDYSKFSRDTEKLIRAGQQIFHLQYDNDLNVFLVGFENENMTGSILLHFNNKLLFEKLAYSLSNYISYKAEPEKRPIADEEIFDCNNGKIVFNMVKNTLSFESPINQITIHNLNQINIAKQILQFFNDNSNNPINVQRFVYPLTDSLLSNMAMRYDHSFGLWGEDEPERAKATLDKLRQLHTLFALNLSNEEITAQLNIGDISVKQLREEVEGDGFYNPSNNTELHKYPHKMFTKKGYK